MTKAGNDSSNFLMRLMGGGGGLDFDSKDNYRDVAKLGTTDDGCKALAEALGWSVSNSRPSQECSSKPLKPLQEDLDKLIEKSKKTSGT